MVGWIQMMFGIQRYNEEMQVKFKYGCGPIIIGGVIALALRKCIENDSFHSYFRFSIYVFSSPEPKAQLSYCHSNLSVVLCHEH